MQLLVGTSGFAYDFWKGSFYPEDIDGADMLAFYAGRFSTVEINNTFYRMPKTEVVERWAAAVPEHFRFAIKASQRITHKARLEDCQDSIDYLYARLEPLGDKLGAVLFQCPPYLRKSAGRLERFIAMLPTHARAVLEFRHDSWFDDEIYTALRQAGVAMCIGDYEGKQAGGLEGGQTPFVATAPWGYVRLRDESYDDAVLATWRERLVSTWPGAYVFFKHEPTAPALVERMLAVRP